MVPKLCTIAECNAAYLCRGLCRKHYSRVRRSGTPEIIPMDPMSQFLRNTHKTETCWLWTGYVSPENRGVINFKEGKKFAYRLGYELQTGARPLFLKLTTTPKCTNCGTFWSSPSAPN